MRIAGNSRLCSLLFISIAATGLLATGATRPALAHSFYDIECCSGIDCKPVPDGEIKATKEGWLIRTTGEIIKYNSWPVKHSPDGHFHRCAGLGDFSPRGRTQCIYVPDFGE
ncbi:hypothetical protein [Mycoplana rhizolycopersici]|jgi:hypothetical protein|uniref:Secreted protein n=1 Tax=Mycoplana rhizolycopersici TaxID=2746702 RepID=A0ABX2QIJ4_9HYPH|nr:hypothetical protein [Rhizobium rhizolycopersici]NVP57577.1 hypothetical protein [Rhizobium rhizolycopersici]